MQPFASLCNRYGIRPEEIAPRLGIPLSHARAIDLGLAFFARADLEHVCARIGCSIGEVIAACEASARHRDQAALPVELAEVERMTNELWLRHRAHPLPYLRKHGQPLAGDPRSVLAGMLSRRLLEQHIEHIAPAATDEGFRVKGYVVKVPPSTPFG